jgi:Helix-turn-helix domain
VSIQAIAWVFDYSQAAGTDRLVLLALANHANSETGECHPGFRRIAHEANCAPSTVTAAIRRLVELGEVEVSARGTGRATTKYHLPWLSTGGLSARPGPNATGGVVRGEWPVVRGNGPVVRGLDRADPLTVNRTAHDAPTPSGVGAPNPTRDVAEIRTLDDKARDGAVPMPPNFRELVQGSKDRHPSNGGPK